MRVRLPTPLDGYTGGTRETEAGGADVGEVLDALDARWPGIRFRLVDEQDRIRTHIRVFVNGETATGLAHRLSPADEVMIVAALGGG